MSFGILTLATSHDYRKAIGLALSLRVSNPGVPTAIACSPSLRARLAPFFDHVIDEDPALRGFVHKVHLDRYSPFEDTFFFDADVLVFRDLKTKVQEWNDQPYNACGFYVRDGLSSFGLDRGRVRRLLGKENFVEISGAGHAYFRKPGCVKVFELAREVTRDYRHYAGDIVYADEDVMNIVLTMLDLSPRPYSGFFSCHDSAVRGTLELDAATSQCAMIERSTGKPHRPYMMRFVRNQAPFPYAHQLHRLFRKFGADSSGIYRAAFGDFWDVEVMWRAKDLLKKVLGPRRAATRLPCAVWRRVATCTR